MTKAERGQLLRERFKACGGQQLPPREPRPKKEPRVYRPKFCFGPLQTVQLCEWVKQADKVEPETVRPSRIARPSHLTRIAEKWRAKPLMKDPAFPKKGG